MDIVLLNERITIQKNAAETDSYGNHLNGWQDYFTCHATVGGESGTAKTETEDAGVMVDNSSCTFTVRWCSLTSVVEPTGYRVIFRDSIYNIVSVDHQNYKRRSVKFFCQKVRR